VNSAPEGDLSFHPGPLRILSPFFVVMRQFYAYRLFTRSYLDRGGIIPQESRGQMKITLPWILLLTLATLSLFAQEVSYHSISHYIETGTIAVSLGHPKAELLRGARLTTPENIRILADVNTICVLPYDARNAEAVIKNLPSTELIKHDLATDKALRQQRNEAVEELTKQDFKITDCLASSSPADSAEIVFTKLVGGFGATDLPTFYWVLYANEKYAQEVHGEKELLGLARPASGWLPLSISSMAEQVTDVVKLARGS